MKEYRKYQGERKIKFDRSEASGDMATIRRRLNASNTTTLKKMKHKE